MTMNKVWGVICGLSLAAIVTAQIALADAMMGNPAGNSSGSAEMGPPQPQCNGSDMGTSTDPRVPPAGVYSSRSSDGSTNTLYTTGDKKPYYVDNPCSNNNAAMNNLPPPQVLVQPIPR